MKRGLLLAVLLWGCAQSTPEALEDDPVQAADSGVDEREPLREPVAAAPSALLPRELECVSAIEVEEGREASAWRATLLLDPDIARISLVGAARFQSHAGAWSGEPIPDTRDEELHATGPLTFAGGAEHEVVIELSADAPFFTAALALDGTATELVCWDRIGIFGSSWSTQPLALPRFDPAQGGCVTAAGGPAALTVLPLEFVLDTYHGDCADLRGAQLNAGDYANPDIYVNLRGADLTGASLQFAQLSGSFEGARLGGLDYGYASVSGSIDEATVLPALGDCVVTETDWGNDSVTCQR